MYFAAGVLPRPLGEAVGAHTQSTTLLDPLVDTGPTDTVNSNIPFLSGYSLRASSTTRTGFNKYSDFVVDHRMMLTFYQDAADTNNCEATLRLMPCELCSSWLRMSSALRTCPLRFGL